MVCENFMKSHFLRWKQSLFSAEIVTFYAEEIVIFYGGIVTFFGGNSHFLWRNSHFLWQKKSLFMAERISENPHQPGNT